MRGWEDRIGSIEGRKERKEKGGGLEAALGRRGGGGVSECGA